MERVCAPLNLPAYLRIRWNTAKVTIMCKALVLTLRCRTIERKVKKDVIKRKRE